MKCNKISYLLLLSGSVVASHVSMAVTPYLSYRSQGSDSAQLLVGTSNFYHKRPVYVIETNVSAQSALKKGFFARSFDSAKNLFSRKKVAVAAQTHTKKVFKKEDSESNYGVFSVTTGYNRSFDSDAISQALFGNALQKCHDLKITGSSVVGRNATKDLLANWFDLSHTYQGTISFEPMIQNATVNLSFYCGLDKWVQGLYFRLDAPLAWTKWDLNAQFRTAEKGTSLVPSVTWLDSSVKFFCERKVAAGSPTLDYPLNAARFCGCACDDAKAMIRLADVKADLGWDFLKRDHGHLGLFVRGVAPTGNRPEGRWLFEPVVGNGHHWELGGGLTASALFWCNKTEDKHIGFVIEAQATHLFNALQQRVFDLKNKPLSRYMSASRLTAAGLTRTAPLANLTATTINSSFALQADVVALFNATLKNWSLDLGYNFWMRTAEVLRCSGSTNKCFGPSIVTNGLPAEINDASLWLVDFTSTIHADNLGVKRVVTKSDIDYDGARTKSMSHKVFGHIDYAWMDRDVVPFIGIGAQGEFGRNEKCSTTVPAVTCVKNTACAKSSKYVALSQWGVWLKGGVSF